jgi:hypothetical protein
MRFLSIFNLKFKSTACNNDVVLEYYNYFVTVVPLHSKL